MALKAEVSGLDDPGMNRPDGHLVHLVALDAVEVRHADRGILAARSAECLVPGPIRTVVTDGLEPRVADRAQTKLLRDLPFEQMQLRDRRG